MRIAIEARLSSGSSGGSQQVIIGLARGLSSLTDRSDDFRFIVRKPGGEWLLPYLQGNCRPVWVETPQAPPPPPSRYAALRRLVPAEIRAVLRRVRRSVISPHFQPPASDGVAEREGCQIVHFPYQAAYVTDLPSLYHPHDLQHLHLPENFDRAERIFREKSYRFFCQRARLVPVTSTWVKNDLIRQYGLPAEKVSVIPLAPINEDDPAPSANQIAEVRARFELPDAFVLYPAQTWRHKNHAGLLRALFELNRQQRGRDIRLVFSGFKNEHFAELDRLVADLQLKSQVSFLGYVTQAELACLYRLARCVVIPSKFEAASFPLWEAFSAGVPAACSNVTSLPAQAGDAALLFDPDDPSQIGGAVERLWNDAQLREQLATKGRASVARFTWRRTAERFRAHYERLLGEPLSDHDHGLLRDSTDL